jgi:predicted nucleic acid-binding protein
MILVDTCIWVDHLHHGEPMLSDLLERIDVCTHPMIIGELALGAIPGRQGVLELLQNLPSAMPATGEEVLALVAAEALFGQGLSVVDAHLLATTRINPGLALWTRDRRLRAAASRLGVAASLD